MSYIFGGSTGETAESIARKRAVAAQMMRPRGAVNTVGEGISKAAESVAGALLERYGAKQQQEANAAAWAPIAEALASRGQPQAAPEGFSLDAVAETLDMPSTGRTGGSRSWRNNNPGNIEFGPFAERHGAVGSDGRFAIFPSEEAGRGAMESLLFGPSYVNLSISDAIGRYAPASDNNDVGAYVESVANATGLAPDTTLSSMTPEQRSAFVDAMIRHEGWTPGTVSEPTATAMHRPATAQVSQAMMQRQDMLPMLMQAAASGHLNEGQTAVVQALLAREMAQPETMTPYQQASLGLRQRELEARLGGRISDAPVVNVNSAAQPPQVGSIPQGYQLEPTENGGWRMAPIPGGPAAAEIANEQRAAAEAATQAGRAGGIVLEDIGRLRSKIENAPWYSPVTGVGSLLSGIPGTDAFDAQALQQTIAANIGFDRLQQMREASPTGGALGAVSERELSTLQAVLGNIELSQSEEQLLENLDRLDTIYRGIMEKAAAYPNAAEFGFGAEPAQPQRQRLIYNPETGELE